MQIASPDDQILNQSKLCHLLAKFATNASGAMLLLNLIQVKEVNFWVRCASGNVSLLLLLLLEPFSLAVLNAEFKELV